MVQSCTLSTTLSKYSDYQSTLSNFDGQRLSISGSSGIAASPFSGKRTSDTAALEREALKVAFHEITNTRDLTLDAIEYGVVSATSANPHWQLNQSPRLKSVFYDTGKVLIPAVHIELDVNNTNNERHYERFIISLDKLKVLHRNSVALTQHHTAIVSMLKLMVVQCKAPR